MVNIIYISLGVFLTGFLFWIVWEVQPEKVVLNDKALIRKYKHKSQRLSLSDLKEIKYHYSAVAGVISLWEFIDVEGNALKISGDAHGINHVLLDLEKRLPEFSVAHFKDRLKAGEVEDTITVWQKA